MATIVILGGGVSGHTAASFASKWLNKSHEVVVVTPNDKWNWIPSNIWVGVGEMSKEDVTFDLAPVYKKAGITYKQAKGVSLHPEGKKGDTKSFVTIEHTSDKDMGKNEDIQYDYLINATGPKLNFGATDGLGKGSELGKHTVSVCTPDHAVHASEELKKCIEKMREGKRQKFLVGTGHGMCTCQGAAFEYAFNVEHEIDKAGLRDMADIKWISNESFLGDFGMGGMHMKVGGYTVSSKIFAESLYAEKGINWILGAHVNKVEKGKVTYELLDGSTDNQETFDFAMLIPPFAGVGLKAFDKEEKDITSIVFAPNGFMKVDAKYDAGDYENWKASDWPKHYQNPTYDNLFACGIAFAPPHPISQPKKSPNGTPISPTPPRTGMPAAIIGKTVAKSICDLITKGEKAVLGEAPMSNMGAACVASAGKGLFSGKAASMVVYPVVPDYDKYPETGRDLNNTFGEVGLAGHWLKHMLHYTFIWKAKLKPGWSLIPE